MIEAPLTPAALRPLVRASGSATTVVRTLLDTLAASGCTFAHHGDFDWPGIALVNRITQRYGAESWRMRAADYDTWQPAPNGTAPPSLPSRARRL